MTHDVFACRLKTPHPILAVGLVVAFLALTNFVEAQSSTARDSLEVERFARAFQTARTSPDSLKRYGDVIARADSFYEIALADSLSGLREYLIKILALRAAAALPVMRHELAAAERTKSCATARSALLIAQKAATRVATSECQNCNDPFLPVLREFERVDSVTTSLCR